MKIKFSITDPASIDAAADKLSDYLDSFDNKCRRFLERLAQIGVDVASAGFASAAYDGVNDVTVNPPQWMNDNTLIVSASGSSITFIEFGAGVYNTGVHPLAGELGMTRGGYGKGYGKRRQWGYYDNGGGLTAGGKRLSNGVVLTKGNDANRSMYNASREMRQQIIGIAREVFGSG